MLSYRLRRPMYIYNCIIPGIVPGIIIIIIITLHLLPASSSKNPQQQQQLIGSNVLGNTGKYYHYTHIHTHTYIHI